MEASVRTRQIGSATYRIALTGEFDMYTAPGFKNHLHTCIERGASEVTVDLSVVCPDSIRKIFEITGLDRVLTIAEAPAVAAETCDVTIT